MMLRILKDKALRLCREEDGVALVTTLAVFLFIYFTCIGIFAIGASVKDKVHLQNACDAAAYSAAVVQADSLSRLATLNRAMAWTYIALTRRQMDYIAWKWLDHAGRHVRSDAGEMIRAGSPGRHAHPFWYVGARTTRVGSSSGHRFASRRLAELGVNGRRRGLAEVESAADSFVDFHLPGSKSSFYSGGATVAGLRKQIDDDKRTIEDMNRAEEALADSMPARIASAAREVFAANHIPEWGDAMPFIGQSGNPRRDYMRVMRGDEEREFLSFAKYSPESAARPFGAGSGAGEWFPLSGGGIKREYVQRGKLCAEWHSWSCRWVCPPRGGCYPVATTPGCRHACAGHGPGGCDRCTGSPVRHAVLLAGHLRPDGYKGRDLFEGVDARPLVLTRDYFGGSRGDSKTGGTITVGVAKKNANPWFAILGTVAGGIYSAFNHGAPLPWTPQYTVCLAAAKAGYKFLGQAEGDRGYRVDWQGRNQSWNLCQSDWDAVVLPVRQAGAAAMDGEWADDAQAGVRRGGFLRRCIENGLGVGADRMRAGGDGSRDPRGVRAKWQIGNPGRPIVWKDMERMMFH